MPMSLYVLKDTPTTDQVTLDISPTDITLIVGDFRVTTSRSAGGDLIDTALMLDKLQQLVPAMRHQVESDLMAVRRAAQQRENAAARAGQQPPARPCVCGRPDVAGVTHRLDGPCYRDEQRLPEGPRPSTISAPSPVPAQGGTGGTSFVRPYVDNTATPTGTADRAERSKAEETRDLTDSTNVFHRPERDGTPAQNP